MKLSELKAIQHLLPDDTEVTISNVTSKKSDWTLIRREWGNHDGRYNMECTKCKWMSDDIPLNGTAPTVCPKCNGKG